MNRRPLQFVLAIVLTTLCICDRIDAQSSNERFLKTILPTLKTYCFDCHSGDAKEGGVQFESENLAELLKDKELWLKVLRIVRADMMPPRDSQQPSSEAKRTLADWIHSEVFEIQ